MVVCQQCGRPFRPDPRNGEIQKTCSRPKCQRARRRAALRLWRVLHPQNVKIHGQRDRARMTANPGYWRQYRQEHPAYYQQDLFRRRQAYRAGLLSANETLMRDLSQRKLEALRALQVPSFSANETPIDRRVELVVDYLVWKARSAKEIPIDPVPADRG